MAPFAEEITRINNRYFAQQRRARKYPYIRPNGPSGYRRDRLQAKAERERREALIRLMGVPYR